MHQATLNRKPCFSFGAGSMAALRAQKVGGQQPQQQPSLGQTGSGIWQSGSGVPLSSTMSTNSGWQSGTTTPQPKQGSSSDTEFDIFFANRWVLSYCGRCLCKFQPSKRQPHHLPAFAQPSASTGSLTRTPFTKQLMLERSDVHRLVACRFGSSSGGTTPTHTLSGGDWQQKASQPRQSKPSDDFDDLLALRTSR